jgi:16S rRNA (guanine966-N2)-methyltransferase
MRIVAGRFKGHRLAVPRTDAIRPTSDRVREAVFNILAHGIDGFVLEGARVLDLFAGTGALGLEALSRGAVSCVFVEEDAEARGLIRQNVEALGLTGVTKIFRRDATRLGSAGRLGPFDLLLADPPYGQGAGEMAVQAAHVGGWLADGAIVMLEERGGIEVLLPAGVAELDRRVYGDTQIVLARASRRGG